MRDLAAILLAAGGSARLGKPKQLLKFQGKTLLRRAAELALAVGCDPVVVVLGHQAQEMRNELNDLPVQSTINAAWQRGIGSSIRHGITHLLERHPDVAAAILLLCDQPLLTPGDLRNLMEAAEHSDKPVCVCSYENTIGPPVLIRRPSFASLQVLPDSQGAKAIWSNHPEWIHSVPCAHAATDIDIAEDFQRLSGSGGT